MKIAATRALGALRGVLSIKVGYLTYNQYHALQFPSSLFYNFLPCLALPCLALPLQYMKIHKGVFMWANRGRLRKRTTKHGKQTGIALKL